MNDLALPLELQRDPPDTAEGGSAPVDAPHVLHLAGRLTRTVLRFIHPASQALADAGYRQTLLIFDDPRCNEQIPALDERIDIVALPMSGSVARDWAAYAARVRALCAARSHEAVHVHGVLPWVMGTRLGRALPPGPGLYFSPHASKALRVMPPLRWLVRRLVGLPQPQRHAAVITSDPRDTRQMHDSGVPAVPVGLTVGAAYFAAQRREARRPLVVSGMETADRRSIETFSRLAVLLSASELGLSFNWVGQADAGSAARLKAANVGLFETLADADVVARMASGWVWLAAGGRRGWPVMLARAMAAGLPCLAADTPVHRELIRHGETGLLYRTDEQALELLSSLLDDAALRERLGSAARQAALLRFSPQTFSSALLSAYRGQRAA